MDEKKMWILEVYAYETKIFVVLKENVSLRRQETPFIISFITSRVLLLSPVFFCLIFLRTTYFNFQDKENILF